jgi:hypothetical protein
MLSLDTTSLQGHFPKNAWFEVRSMIECKFFFLLEEPSQNACFEVRSMIECKFFFLLEEPQEGKFKSWF